VNRAADNRSMLKRLAFFALVMFGFGFAMVPFYRAICDAVGLNSLVARDSAAANSQVDESRWVTVEFDANTRGLPWSFTPERRSMRVHPGALVHVVYEVRNDSAQSVVGQAVPSYGPKDAGPYFRKLECFCFQKQAFAPGERREMPVVFVIDPSLPKEVATVTLSYTFFQLNAAPAAAATGRVSG
jgi:cytochrome c oxidase assembly protein subunit 11